MEAMNICSRFLERSFEHCPEDGGGKAQMARRQLEGDGRDRRLLGGFRVVNMLEIGILVIFGRVPGINPRFLDCSSRPLCPDSGGADRFNLPGRGW